MTYARNFISKEANAMANKSYRDDVKATSSGHGALGMGGQPADDPRDLHSGHERLTNDERTRAVAGARGKARRNDPSGGSVAGVPGDNAATRAARRKPGP
jgi:hypothetical protein